MAIRNVRDSIELALAIGIDTGKEISSDAERIEAIKPMSSDELETFCSEIKQCTENSKYVILDTLPVVKSMTRDEMIEFIKANPGVKVTHELFSADEYLYAAGIGNVYDENGYLFEDWSSPMHNGIRMRTGGAWEDGWKVYKS